MTEYNKTSELLLHLLHGGGTRKAAVIFCKQVLGSERRNAARADVTPPVTTSANQRCPGRHTGQACRSALTRVVSAATCCTIAEKLEQLVPRMTPFISRNRPVFKRCDCWRWLCERDACVIPKNISPD